MFRIQEIDVILVVVDRFIKYVVFIFVRSNINTVKLTELVYSYINIRFDLSLNIIFDRSLVFTNEF